MRQWSAVRPDCRRLIWMVLRQVQTLDVPTRVASPNSQSATFRSLQIVFALVGAGLQWLSSLKSASRSDLAISSSIEHFRGAIMNSSINAFASTISSSINSQ